MGVKRPSVGVWEKLSPENAVGLAGRGRLRQGPGAIQPEVARGQGRAEEGHPWALAFSNGETRPFPQAVFSAARGSRGFI